MKLPLLFLSLLCLAFAGCDAGDSTVCREHAVKSVPDAVEVATVPGDSFIFLIRDKRGVLWQVECYHLFDAEPSLMMPIGFVPIR